MKTDVRAHARSTLYPFPSGLLTLGALLLFWMVTFSTRSNEVPWLTEVQQPPFPIPIPARALTPLLPEKDLGSPHALSQWRRHRSELQRHWLNLLGPMPQRPKSTRFETLQTEQIEGVTRKRIRYENEPGQFLEAYLLLPSTDPMRSSLGTTSTSRRRAGLIALHATTDQSNGPIAGVGGRDDEQLGLKLARQGFVVLCPRNFLWVNAPQLKDAVAQFQQRHPDTLGIHKMLYDAQRATDILAALPEVDPHRLGSVGHSLGAKEVLYLTAFDERIRASVFSEGGIAFDSTNWDAPWYLGPKIHQSEFARNHHELLALIAPRPFLILGGESGPGAADGNRSWPYLQAARSIYALYGPPMRFGLLNHHEGHKISDATFARLSEWLKTYLQ